MNGCDGVGVIPCLGGWTVGVSLQFSRCIAIFPEVWPRIGMATAVREPTDEAIKDVLRLFVGNSSARAKKRTCLVIARLSSWRFESSSHNPEGFEGAPPGAESSDRRNWAGTCVCANNVQRKCLVPTRTVGSNPAPATRRKDLVSQDTKSFLLIFPFLQ